MSKIASLITDFRTKMVHDFLKRRGRTGSTIIHRLGLADPRALPSLGGRRIVPRKLFVVGFLILTIIVLTGTALAEANKYGVADKQQVNFSDPVRVGDVLLPPGDYQVRHTMEGDNHVMVFKQLGVKRPAGVSVKCNLVPVAMPISRTQVGFAVNAAGEYVLHRLAFKGDRAEHWF